MINWKFWQKERLTDAELLNTARIYLKNIWKDDWRADDQAVIDFAKAIIRLGDKYEIR